jgi:hypothetical protein
MPGADQQQSDGQATSASLATGSERPGASSMLFPGRMTFAQDWAGTHRPRMDHQRERRALARAVRSHVRPRCSTNFGPAAARKAVGTLSS